MARTRFNISVKPGQEGIDCAKTVIELGQQQLSYAIYGPGEELLGYRNYELDGAAPEAELSALINDDEKLRNAAGRKILLYNYPEAAFVPGVYYSPSTGEAHLELLHGELPAATIVTEKGEGTSDGYFVYAVPTQVHRLFQQQLPVNRSFHYYNVLQHAEETRLKDTASYLLVTFYPGRLLVYAGSRGQVQLIRSFYYEAAEDVAYYLLNICQQLALSPATTPVFLSGMIDVSSVLYAEILKYFGIVELDSFATDAFEWPEEHPAHFFSPLLKIATCVS
ncbi:MAG: DUF3822 family protein [Bacteroidota bacterium]|nr:DUF3822 family protein [Bacteroidota bacterium]